MGWWPLGEHGGISGLMDVPRTEELELNLVMGDGPADILGNFLNQVEYPFTKEALIQAVVYDNYSRIPEHLVDGVKKLQTDLLNEWSMNIGRLPYDSELEGCFNFCMQEQAHKWIIFVKLKVAPTSPNGIRCY